MVINSAEKLLVYEHKLARGRALLVTALIIFVLGEPFAMIAWIVSLVKVFQFLRLDVNRLSPMFWLWFGVMGNVILALFLYYGRKWAKWTVTALLTLDFFYGSYLIVKFLNDVIRYHEGLAPLAGTIMLTLLKVAALIIMLRSESVSVFLEEQRKTA